MPKKRLQVDSGIGPAGLRPVASPVDTFVPQTADAHQLEQLAQGLAALSPALGRFSDVLAKRTAEEQFEAGKKRARELTESAKSFRDAIRDGKITPDQSPWFMAGLREQFGRLAADRMNFDFQTALAKDEKMQSTTEAADFDAFYQSFATGWMKDNLDEGDRNAQFEQGFGNRADAYLADNQRQFASQLAGRVVKFAGDGHFSEVFNSIRTELGRGTSLDTLGAAITAMNDEAVAKGLNGRLVNERTVEAVVAAARRLNDTSILGLLDTIQSGPLDGKRSALSATRTGAAAVEEAENDIAQENQVAMNREHQRAEQAKDQAVEGIFGQAVQLLDQANDPHNVDLKPLRQMMQQIAPEKVPLMLQLQDAWSDRTLADDPLQVASAFRRVYTPHAGEHYTSLEEASALLANREMSVPTWRSLVNEIQSRDNEGGTSRFEKDPLLKAAQRQIRAMFVSELGIEGPEMRLKAEEAVDEFTMRYIRWRRGSGKDMNEEQVRTWMHDTRNEVFKSKSGASNLRDFDRIPQANLRPTRPDYTKQLVTDPSNLRLLEEEVERVLQNGRGGFSPQSISVLQYAGIAPDVNAVRDFIRVQRGFLPTFVAPDSTEQY